MDYGVYGPWCVCMNYGVWTMVCMYELWCMDYGVYELWCMDYGVYELWCMNYGVWTMVYGLWCMDHGVSSVCCVRQQPKEAPFAPLAHSGMTVFEKIGLISFRIVAECLRSTTRSLQPAVMDGRIVCETEAIVNGVTRSLTLREGCMFVGTIKLSRIRPASNNIERIVLITIQRTRSVCLILPFL